MKKKRVLLVNFNEIKENNPFPIVAPIGLFYINGYLDKMGYNTKILQILTVVKGESMFDKIEYREKIKSEIEKFNPDYIGLSFRNILFDGLKSKKDLIEIFSISEDIKFVNLFREIANVKIIGGGSAFSLQPVFYMKYLNLDFGIVGEGEIAFDRLISSLESNSESKEIPGLVYWKENNIVINKNKFIDNLDEMPLMKIDSSLNFKELYYDNGAHLTIQTKRGCYFNCIYCTYPFLEGKKYRLKDIKKLVEEIKYIKSATSLDRFFIVDSVFSTPVQHSINFCRSLIRNKVNIKWTAYINPRGITRELLELYKISGCERLYVTPDTLSEKVLKTYRKDFSMDEVKECFQLLKESNIPFAVDCILGGPGEDEETVSEALEFYNKYLYGYPVGFSVGMWLHTNIPEINYIHPPEVLIKNTCLNYNDNLNNFIDISPTVIDKNGIAFENLVYFFPDIKENREERIIHILEKIIESGLGVVGDDPTIQSLIRNAYLRNLSKKEKSSQRI